MAEETPNRTGAWALGTSARALGRSGAQALSSELALAASLYSAIACGHERLEYNVAGTFALWSREAVGWRPVSGAERVPPGEWRPCLEVLPDGTSRPRRLNPWTIAGHVRGRGSVAPSAPSWCGWIAFDIDAHVAREVLADDSDEVIPLAAMRRALLQRDEVLGELWRALELGPDREPLVLRSPGQGFHVYLPLTRGPGSPTEHTWPAREIVERTCEVLHRRGVVLAAGRLELYPAGQRLRAPCGLGSVLLRATRAEVADDLGLEPVAGTIAMRRRPRGGDDDVEQVRRPWAMVAAFLAQWEAARKPLGEWLRSPAAVWSSAWGPFAREDRAAQPPAGGDFVEKSCAVTSGYERRSQHIDEVGGGPAGRQGVNARAGRVRSGRRVGQGGIASGSEPRSVLDLSGSASPVAAPGLSPSSSPLLRRGREFRAHLGELIRRGVVQPGSRHDAVLSLVFWWHCSGKSEAAVREELEIWARAHPHVSKLKGERFVRTCLREGMHYYHRIKLLPQRARALAATLTRTRELRPADLLVVGKVREDVREEAWAILEYLHGHADRDGRVARPVTLGRAQLEALVGGDRRVPIDGRGRHRAEVVAVRELERLGVLALFCDYSTGNHGRVFTCWYQFGSGMLAMSREPGTQARSRARCAAPAEALVVAERRVREGTLRILCDGTRRPPWVEVEPAAGVSIEETGGASWWRPIYEGQRFTPGELHAADEAILIFGPWRRDRLPRYGAVVEDLVEVPRSPAPAPATAPAPPADPRAELAAELGADVAQLGDYPADLAAIAARALRTFDRRG